MSDMNDGKHDQARKMAEAAMRAEQEGDTDRADDLIAQAEKADPDAVLDVISERDDETIPFETSNDELSVESETVQPHSDAPSRAGISGSGSGADNQGL